MVLGTVLSGHKRSFEMVLVMSKCVKSGFIIDGLEWKKRGKWIIGHI